MNELTTSIQQYLEKFTHEMEMGPLYEKISEKEFLLLFEEKNTSLIISGDSFILLRNLEEIPKEESESLCAYLLYANFLGQGTGYSCLSLREDMQTIALNMLISYEVTYKNFLEIIEEFVNYADFLTDEIKKKKNSDM